MSRTLGGSFLAAALVVSASGALPAAEAPDIWVKAIRPPQYFAVYVKDVNKSVDWYCTVFGLNKLGGSAARDGSWQIENLGNDQLMVEIIRDHRSQGVDRAFGFRKVGFNVPDVEGVARRIERATGDKPRIVEFQQLSQRILQLRDPDGNIVQLFSMIEKKN